jgi:cysteine synthase
MRLTDIQESLRALGASRDIHSFGRTVQQRSILEPLMADLGVTSIRVDDITERLALTKGRVFAVRWDITSETVGFKQPIMSSLLLFHLWKRKADVSDVGILIDGGNVNTGLALSYLASRLGLRAEHVLSRHFPLNIRDYIVAHGSEGLTLIEAPPSNVGKEREFYGYLFHLMRSAERQRSRLCLWHAKYSGLATRWMGEAFAESWGVMPDDIVLSLGSGSTLEGYAIPLKNRFDGSPRIVVAEHELSRLIQNKPTINLLSDSKDSSAFAAEFSEPPHPIPHAVLGPHYDDLNPLIDPGQFSQIDAVAPYRDRDWQTTSHFSRLQNMPIGNSSAANLAVARGLAAQGRVVFTFIYEPLRDFYVPEARYEHEDERGELLEMVI